MANVQSSLVSTTLEVVVQRYFFTMVTITEQPLILTRQSIYKTAIVLMITVFMATVITRRRKIKQKDSFLAHCIV